MGAVAAVLDSPGRGRSFLEVIRELQARFANGPAECAAAHLSRDGESKVRATRAEFAGMKEIKKRRKEMLGGVLASERRKRCADLARGAVDSRNKNQEYDPLADRMESARPARSNQLQKDFVDR